MFAIMAAIMQQKITIIGGGLVGLALANKLAQAGIAIDLYERQQPPLDFAPGTTARVSALNLPSRQLLQSLGVWGQLRQTTVALVTKIEAWTYSNSGCVQFSATDLGQRYLAFIVENREIQRVLWQAAVANPQITLYIGSIDELPSSQLVIGADGGQSQVRAKAGIEIKQRSYGQQAIVATIHTAKPHQQHAYQNFLKTGPLGILPLADPNTVSIVWSADDSYAQELMAMDEASFNIALSNALDLKLGKLTLASKRHVFPLIMRHVEHYVKPGVALVGDAAHTIHPLAGQGVNLGFKDVSALAEQLLMARDKGQSFAAINVLRKYERARKADNAIMLAMMQLFRNNGYQLGGLFGLVNNVEWLRKKFMALSQ